MSLNQPDWLEAPIQAVLFDMDGVLVDSEPIYFKIERSSFAHFGAAVSEKEHHTYVGVTLESMWEQVLVKHGIHFTLEQVVSYHKENVFKTLSAYKYLHAMPYADNWLSWLKERQVPVAVASSSPRALIELIMDKTGLGRYFNVRVSGEEVMHGKPAPDIFLHAAELLGVEPSSCLVIEDSRNGVQAAKSAGMRCIGFQNPGSGSQDLSLADHRITSYEQLWAIRNSLPLGEYSQLALDKQL
ncbi:beta-phosphoglucomutase family hydrolase [Paenibacillus forsythiae]|uniref:Beta-phosphoglucomutase n=1 Tax=Paenibacillus forsythiae TaxID=365616 RepID=A0ABU3HES6_9BACL|nr:HAD family phosphatase [Paenibacillus forsythiae]MDT3429230.1 beta-phosphoglucomutase family hydrolase [Paenibacillus forsythiae]